jgi:hypothetical protein
MEGGRVEDGERCTAAEKGFHVHKMEILSYHTKQTSKVLISVSKQ